MCDLVSHRWLNAGGVQTGLGTGAYLAGAHLVEGNKSPRLQQHGRRQVRLCHDERDQHAREQKLGHKSHGLDGRGGSGSWVGGGEIQQDVVGAEVVAMVDAGDVVEIGMQEERMAIDGVHEQVEGKEGSQAENGEQESRGSEEGQHSVQRRLLGACWR